MYEDFQAAFVDIRNAIASLQSENRLLVRYVKELMNADSINLSNSMLLTTTRFGRQMVIDGRDMGSGLEIAVSGKIESANMRVLQRCFMPGVTFLDIGANYGFYTVMASSQIGVGGRLFAFEANPKLMPYLERNSEINGLTNQLTIVNKAVSDRLGAAEFGFSLGESGGGSLAKGIFAKNAETEQQPCRDRYIEVPLVRIDDVVPTDLIVDVVKIDVEGNEGSVLRGMRETISRSPNIQILMEFAPALLSNDRGSADVLHELDKLGLGFWRVDANGHLEEVSAEALNNGSSCDLVAAREKPDDRSLTLPKAALLFPKAPDPDGAYSGSVGEVLVYGPYWFLQRGVYDISVTGTITGAFAVMLTHEFGHVVATGVLTSETKTFRVRVEDDLRFFEVVIRASEIDSRLALDCIVIRDA